MPGPAEPGHILRQFTQPPQPHAPEKPIITPLPETGGVPPNADKIKFVLKGFVIEGATVYPPASFLPLYKALLGTEIPLRKVFDVADAITAKYRRDGYLLSLAVVPAQKITNGVVRLKVVEGFIDRVFIDGHLGKRGTLVREMADNIAAARPLTAAVLERYVLLINDLPGLTARALLKRSQVPGAADLVLTVDEKSWDGYASIDNRGSRYIGPAQTNLSISANSMLGYNERTTFRTTVTSQVGELKFFDLDEVVPLNAEGTRGRIQVSQSYAHPGYILKPDAVRAKTTTLLFGGSHPLIRSRAKNLSIHGDFDMRWIEADEDDGATLISKDSIRAIRLGAEYDFVDTLLRPAVSLISVEASQGLDILGARKSGSPDLSRVGGRSDFTKLTLDAQRLQHLGGGFSLLTALTGQYSFSTLLTAEEFSFGGSDFGRGYDPATLTGDDGLAGKLELAYGAEPGASLLQAYQLYGFYDIGTVWNRDPAAGESGRSSAASAGIGVRANISSRFSANMELAMPLTARTDSAGEGDKDPRFFVSLVGRF